MTGVRVLSAPHLCSLLLLPGFTWKMKSGLLSVGTIDVLVRQTSTENLESNLRLTVYKKISKWEFKLLKNMNNTIFF